MHALVRFRFVRDLLIHVEGELQPRAYTAPFVYDLKLPVARLAVAGGHGDIIEIHGVDLDAADEVASELLALVPDPPTAEPGLPPVSAAPTSDAVVVAASKALGPAPPPPPPVPTSDEVVAAAAKALGPAPAPPPPPPTSDAVVIASLSQEV